MNRKTLVNTIARKHFYAAVAELSTFDVVNIPNSHKDWYIIGTDFLHHIGPSVKLATQAGSRRYALITECTGLNQEKEE